MSTDTVEPAQPQSETPPEEEVMDMGALLESEAAQPGQLRRGEIVEGVVMGASTDGMLVDVGIKTEAIIPQGEMLSLGVDGGEKLQAGDSVKVMVLQPMTAEGHALVSLDRARGEEGWDTLAERLESGEVFDGQVTGHNRGGVLVNVEGVNAFVPLSQIDSVRRDSPEAVTELSNLVGQSIRLKVLELNRKRNRVILSERAAMTEWRRDQKDRILEDLQEGEIREGIVSSITDFGVFVDLGGADGLAHMTELTWERGKKAKELYTVGDTVKAYILKVDRDTKKISLSLKRAHPEKWDATVDRYVIGQILIGRVTKLMAFGAFVRLDGPVEGLIHISELSNRRIQHPKDVVKEGDVVPVKLVRIEKDRHRLGLSLRQARPDAEAMGFVFDGSGAVIDYPDDVRSQFDLPARDDTAPRPRPAPRNAQEAIERAVARDPEPVSAFAHAFAQALENAESGTIEVEGGQVTPSSDVVSADQQADTAVPSAEVPAEVETEATAEPADEPVAEVSADAEATAEPADEPVAEVSAEAEAEATAEPADEPVAEVSAEAVAEATAEPADEPVAEVSAEAEAEAPDEPADEPVAEVSTEAEAETNASPSEPDSDESTSDSPVASITEKTATDEAETRNTGTDDSAPVEDEAPDDATEEDTAAGNA